MKFDGLSDLLSQVPSLSIFQRDHSVENHFVLVHFTGTFCTSIDTFLGMKGAEFLGMGSPLAGDAKSTSSNAYRRPKDGRKYSIFYIFCLNLSPPVSGHPHFTRGKIRASLGFQHRLPMLPNVKPCSWPTACALRLSGREIRPILEAKADMPHIVTREQRP